MMVFDMMIEKIFLPTPSRRGRRATGRYCQLVYHFYPRPRVEGDAQAPRAEPTQKNFYPRPRVEGDSGLNGRW